MIRKTISCAILMSRWCLLLLRASWYIYSKILDLNLRHQSGLKHCLCLCTKPKMSNKKLEGILRFLRPQNYLSPRKQRLLIKFVVSFCFVFIHAIFKCLEENGKRTPGELSVKFWQTNCQCTAETQEPCDKSHLSK